MEASEVLGQFDAIWSSDLARAHRTAQIRSLLLWGGGVYAVTGRVEKGYRLMGAELESEYNPVEAGLARPKVKGADFIGKQAYLAARQAAEVDGPVATMCTLSMDSQLCGDGYDRFPTGGNEPILTLDGQRIIFT